MHAGLRWAEHLDAGPEACDLAGAPLDAPVDRPDGFDLTAAWEQIVANVDELRSPHRLELVADADAVHVLRWMFDRQLQVGDTTRVDGCPVRSA